MTNKYYTYLIQSAFFLALFVVVLGAYTRLSDAGLGCPDWPGCYGSTIVANEVDTEKYERPLEVGKAWKEMIHRYAAGTLGILILLIFISAIKLRKELQQPIVLPTALLVTVIFQALLGMWTVTLLLSPTIVTAHLVGGYTSLSLIWWLLLRQGSNRQYVTSSMSSALHSRSWRIFAIIGLVLLIGQILLGGWTSTNYAALACGNAFPTCHGQWLPIQNMSEAFNLSWQNGTDYEFGKLDNELRTTIHVMHRLGALVVFLYLGMLASKLLKHKLGASAKAVLLLLLLQVIIGILNVVLYLPLFIAVLHTLTASLLLLAVITVNYRLYQLQNG